MRTSDPNWSFQARLIGEYLVLRASGGAWITVGSLTQDPRVTPLGLGRAVLSLIGKSDNAISQDDERLLTVTEAARELGISAQTIRNVIRRKGLKVARTPGGHRRVRLRDLGIERVT